MTAMADRRIAKIASLRREGTQWDLRTADLMESEGLRFGQARYRAYDELVAERETAWRAGLEATTAHRDERPSVRTPIHWGSDPETLALVGLN